MAESQSSTNLHLTKESVSTTFNPKTGGFNFSLDTTTLIACLVAVIIVLGLVLFNYKLLGWIGPVSVIFLLGLLGFIVYGIIFPRLQVVKTNNTVSVFGIPTSSLTPEVVGHMIASCLQHFKKPPELPEPDGRYDPQTGKKVDLNTEEKEKIIEEQKQLTEKVTDDLDKILQSSLEKEKNK